MQGISLPFSLGQWREYFNKMFSFVESVLPTVSFGFHKFELVVTHLHKFYDQFVKHDGDLAPAESRNLFEFFKACLCLIGLSYNYQPSKFLSYFLANPTDQQFKDFQLLWDCWSYVARSFGFSDAFHSITLLEYAHFLDLKNLYEALYSKLGNLSEPYRSGIRRKLDDVLYLLRIDPTRPDAPASGLLAHSQFTSIKEIGKGANAVVRLATMNADGKKVAVKELKQLQLNSRNLVTLKRELDALLKLKHPNVLEFIGATIEPPFCIATAYVSGGSLFEALHADTPLTPNHKMRIIVGMARGLEYLAAMRFVHRDFKSQNVLLDEQWNAIIADFGLARTVGSKMTFELGTAQWTAPEVLVQGDTPYDTSCDTFSFAVIVWELITDRYPWEKNRVVQVAVRVLNGERMEIPADVDERLRNIVQKCWDQDPTKRPKMETVRKAFESGEVLLPGTDKAEFMKWIGETKGVHASIMEETQKSAKLEEANIFEQLHTLSPLSPLALKVLQQLSQIDYQFSFELLDDILRLVNQTLSVPVQDSAFDILRKILSKPEALEADPKEIIEKLLVLLESRETEAQYAVSAIKMVIDRVSDVDGMIKRFLSLPQSHAAVELLQAVIVRNVNTISIPTIVSILKTLDPALAEGFFRSMVMACGPKPEFVPVAVSTLAFISVFLKGLAQVCVADPAAVKAILNVPELESESTDGLQQTLEHIATAVKSTGASSNVTEKAGIIIFKFLVVSCIKYNCEAPILPLLNLCTKGSTLTELVAKGNVWPYIIRGIKNESDASDHAFHLIEKLPICEDDATRKEMWTALVSRYEESKDMKATKCIRSLLKRRDDFDLSNLIRLIKDGISGSNQHSCLTALKLARSLSRQGYEELGSGEFWSVLNGHLSNRNVDTCKSIGKLLSRMIDQIPSLSVDPNLLAGVLKFLYPNDTPFEAAAPLILFLTRTCQSQQVMAFLNKHSFCQYLEQLPWRYENEKQVADVIESCVKTLMAYYGMPSQPALSARV